MDGVPVVNLFDFGPPETFDRSQVPKIFWDDEGVTDEVSTKQYNYMVNTDKTDSALTSADLSSNTDDLKNVVNVAQTTCDVSQ